MLPSPAGRNVFTLTLFIVSDMDVVLAGLSHFILLIEELHHEQLSDISVAPTKGKVLYEVFAGRKG